MDNTFSSIIKEVVTSKPPEVIAPKTGVIDTVTKEKSELEPPFDKYSEIKGVPYTAKYFDIDYFSELKPEVDVHKLGQKVNEVERFVKREIESKKYDNTIDSYNDIIGHIKSTLGINKNIVPEVALSRVVEYIKILDKQRALEKKRAEILNGKFKD